MYKKKYIFMIIISSIVIYTFPYYIFSKEYQNNPRLYLVKKEMKKILEEQYIYNKYTNIVEYELRLYYNKKFHGNLVYNEKEWKRLNSYKNGGEPFWECIKKGKLHIIQTKYNTMMIYRHTNKIGTCELTVQRFDPDKFKHNTQNSAGIYFDKRINIGIGEITDFSKVNHLD